MGVPGRLQEGNRGDMNRREKDLQECLLSTVIGGILSYVTCLVLPGVGDTVDTIGLFAIGWFMYIWIVWSVIDFAETKRKAPAGAAQGNSQVHANHSTQEEKC